jgi:hypothetical protein
MPTQNYQHVRMIMTSKSGYNETNFCTVAAIATAFNWSAGKAHRLLAKHGRPHRSGPKWANYTTAVMEACVKAGKDWTFTDAYDGMTIGRFCKENPKGTFIVSVKAHTLTIIDGVMQDWTADTAGRRKIGYRSGFELHGKDAGGVVRIGG